jgi:predicted nuclease of predicted toxin-antitoxin system
MKFLGDMGISGKTISWLRDSGYDAVHLREFGLQRATDPYIMKMAAQDDRVLLTMDLDFGYLLAVSKRRTPSVIIFRLNDEGAEVVNRRLAMVLRQCNAELESGAIVSVNDKSIRTRKLPIKP